MSETNTAGASQAGSSQAASTGAQSQGSSQQQSTPSGTGGFSQAPQAAGNQGQNGKQGEAPSTPEARVLAEQDLDAYIEHTINGRKEKIKVRDLAKSYGLDKTANQRMEEAARMRRDQQQLNHLMQTDFAKYCEVQGINRDEFLRANLSQRKEIAEEILAREYELQQMDPNQRRALDLENQLKQMQTRELSTKQPLIDKIKEIVSADRLPKGLENATVDELRGFLNQRQQEFTQGVDNLSNELLEAWQKVGLPKEKDFGSWMAQVMLDDQRRATEHKKRTGEDLPPLHPEQAAAKVKARFLNSTRTLFSAMDAVAIHEVLGEEIIQKLRAHDVGLASQQNGPSYGNQNRPASNAASEPKKQMGQVEWRKAMGIT